MTSRYHAAADRKANGIARASLAMVVLAAFALDGCGTKSNAGSSPVATPNVPLGIARTGTLVERIDAQGRVGPPTGSSAKLSFAQSGTLRTIDVRIGETVRAGMPLAELDRAALAAPLAQARADARSAASQYGNGAVPDAAARSAEAKVAAASERLRTLERGGPSASDGRTEAAAVARQADVKVRADDVALSRQTQLFAAGVVARKDVEAARQVLETDRADAVVARAKGAAAVTDYASAVVQARAELAAAVADARTAAAQRGVLGAAADSARARVDAASVAFENGILTAPADGVVLAILKHPGEAIDPSSPVIEIGPSSAGEATLTVPARSAARIVVGDGVTYAASDGSAAGHGRVLSVVPVVDRATQMVTVLASGAPADAIEGDAVAASVAIARVSGIRVPLQALVEDPQTGDIVVFVRAGRPASGDSPFAMRRVNVRARDAAFAILASGLRQGERFAASGGYALLAPAGG